MKHLTWQELQKEEPKQTAAIVDFTWKAPGKEPRHQTKIFLANWMSREDAWNGITSKGVTRGISIKSNQEILERNIRLLRLSKIVKDLEERKPKNTFAIKL